MARGRKAAGGRTSTFARHPGQVALLAYNLLNWFKRLCARPSLEHATLQRLRQRLFVTPAQ